MRSFEKLDPKLLLVTYRTRTMPKAYLDRIRVIASLNGMELQEVFNEVIAKGLPLVEEEKGVTCVPKG